MPLNYSKWDQLEVSDDSDIEGHPNVDHKSLVRMKQRTIHEQRYARNQLIAQLEADLALNAELLPRARKIASELKAADDKPAFFSRTVDRLKNAPDPAGPAGGGDSYETMLYHLMLTVYEDVKKAGVKQDDDKLGQALQDALDTHVNGLEEDTKKKEVQLDGEKKEKAKKITTEDIHEGFQSAYVPAKPDPAPVPGADSLAPKSKGKGKQKETTIEVLNPKASGSADVSQADDDDEDSDLPQLTPALIEFSKIPIGRFEQSYQFIQAHREVIVPGAADALLVAAFDAQGNGKPKYSKQCVHQSLLVQYCEKLGGDGVRVFFMKMISGDKRATDVFVKDVEETYQHLKGRVAASKEASAGSGEQIQIVAEGGADSVSFNVPDGPPPAELVLEGEGVQDLDVEEVRKVLQMRWDVFEGFSDELKQALRLNSLDAVNAVLGKMSVEEAEGVVGMLDMGGILNFAEGGVRDETPAGKAAAAAATEPSVSESAESAPKDA